MESKQSRIKLTTLSNLKDYKPLLERELNLKLFDNEAIDLAVINDLKRLKRKYKNQNNNERLF